MSIQRPERYRSFILSGEPGSGKGTRGAILNADQVPIKVFAEIIGMVNDHPEWSSPI